MTNFFHIETHVLPGQYIREYPAATVENQEDTLLLHIKQYTPLRKVKTPRNGITIIGAHANGFPKELYEPFWEELYQRLEGQGISIKSIWIADSAHQGTSGVLNGEKIGNEPCWHDHARDLLYIINTLRDKMPRPLIGIGHSMGGNSLANLALMHPRLLSCLVLIDPVIHIPLSKGESAVWAQLSTFRRDYWPSRENAIASLRNSKYYQSWDKRVLDRWFEVGLIDTPTVLYPETGQTDPRLGQPVTLLTPKHQEVFHYLRPNFDGVDKKGNHVIDRSTHADLDPNLVDVYPFYRAEPASTLNKLPNIRPSVLYLHGGKSAISIPAFREQRLSKTGIGIGGSGGAKAGRVKEVVLESVGHLVPMEAVDESAEAVANWLTLEMQRWRKEEDDFHAKWNQKSRIEKQTIQEEWKEKLGGDPRARIGKPQL